MNRDEVLQSIGDNIRAERNRRRLSQEGLAELAGMNEKHLSQIENGHANFQVLTLLAICRALGVSVSTICGE